MSRPKNLRYFTFLICAVLAVAGVLMISSPTSSEPGAGAPSQEKGKPVQPIGTPGNRPPGSSWSRFYPPGDDCAEAKVDIWLARGVATHSLFVPGAGTSGQRAITRMGEATTILVGGKDCLISIRIERAPAGVSIDDN